MLEMWSKWFEDNYLYICMGACKTEKERQAIMVLDELCRKHDVSVKSMLNIIHEFNEVTKND